MRSLLLAGTVAICLMTSACGTYVPPLQEYTDDKTRGNLVNAILLNVTCEVQDALHDILETDRANYRRGIYREPLAQFLNDWGVQIALSFTIDEKGTLATGLSGTPSAIASLTGNFGGSATATRIDKLNSFYAVREISRERCVEGTRPGGSFMMQSDLKLKEWLKINITSSGTGLIVFPTVNEGPYKQNVISHQVKFVVETNGSFTPGWKLTQVLINQGNDFLSASRTRTHDLTITLGPLDKEQLSKGRIAPSRAAENSALASDIGLSVANNLRADSIRRSFPLSLSGF